ncbi:MAG TPA: hypothetical protein VMV00_00500 [Candidatus Baltobacteraceae bacterium]|nr:hypothetical protein [Candidatus Baltobacteraceae bacterium]
MQIRETNRDTHGGNGGANRSGKITDHLQFLIDKGLIGDPTAKGAARYVRNEALAVLGTPGFDFVLLSNGIRIKITDDIAEVRALVKMHEADPEHTVKPLFSVRDPITPKRSMIAYGMEEAKGMKLDGLLKSEDSKLLSVAIPQAIEQLEAVVRKYHSKGLTHNDIHTSNIIVEIDRKMKVTLKLLDPMVLKLARSELEAAENENVASLVCLMRVVQSSRC